MLGLEIGRDIAQDDSQLDDTPVRQSRRIAQLKIKEEADRRRVEEEALQEMKAKKEGSDQKKRKKQKVRAILYERFSQQTDLVRQCLEIFSVISAGGERGRPRSRTRN